MDSPGNYKRVMVLYCGTYGYSIVVAAHVTMAYEEVEVSLTPALEDVNGML